MSRPSLEAVNELCRLALAARRLGCRVCLCDVTPELAGLIELTGLTDVLLDGDGDGPPRRSDLR